MSNYAQLNGLSDTEARGSLICRKTGRILSLVAGFCGLVVAVGWIINFDFVKSVLPDMATMKFNTSVCFILINLSITLQYNELITETKRLIAKFFAAIALGTSLLTITQYLFGIELGIDQLIVADNLTLPSDAPGRMSPGTSIAFILVSASLLIPDYETATKHSPSQYLVIFSTLLSGAALLGYVYGATGFSLQLFSSMAFNTAFTFVLTGFAILLIRPNRGFMRLFTSDRIGGRTSRIILPLVLIVPIAIGWLSFFGQDMGYYGIEFAFSLFSLLSILILVLIAWFGAKALNNAEEYFMSTFESAPTAMIVVDGDGIINRANSLAESYFGYERQELIGNKIEMLIPKRYNETHPQLRREYTTHPEARKMGEERDLFGLRKDGSEFPVEVGLNPIATPSGMSVLSAITDISQRKGHELELETRTSELARSNHDLEQFAYLASHDLQEPLRAISGSVQLLQSRHNDQLDEKAKLYISHASDGAKRMHTLIQDLLSYARVGRSEENLQPIDLNNALLAATKNLSAVIDKSGAVIDRAQLPTIQGYASQITLLFQNLLGNAIKFQQSDASPIIQIRAIELAEHWEISLSDNGIGIADQFQKRIFEIFQRLHTRSAYEGTGIGLAICKKIVENHGGSIGLKPSSQQGATFFFTIKKQAGN